MMIKKECIGQRYSVRSPYNSCHFSGFIVDDPAQFELYKVLRLDVFETNIPPAAEVIEEKPKKKKKGDTPESNE